MTENSDHDVKKCLECEKEITGTDMVDTEEGSFCQVCYEKILKTVSEIAESQGKDINYVLSALGALLGGVAGGVVWWAVTYFSGYAVGLVAIIIGMTVAKGITLLNGNKKSLNIQIMAVIATVITYFYSQYLVTRSFIIQENQAYTDVFTWFPEPVLMFNLLRETVDLFSLVFLAIAVWQAWKMTQPFELN